MSLHAYVSRLEDILRARNDITLERLRLTVTSIGVIFEARVRLSDGSLLNIVEEVEKSGYQMLRTVVYKFHYQRADGTLVFRYDNSPHYPHLSTFPEHKHRGAEVVAANKPDLADVLREIDASIYQSTESKT